MGSLRISIARKRREKLSDEPAWEIAESAATVDELFTPAVLQREIAIGLM